MRGLRIGVLVVAAFAGACAVNPATGRREIVFMSQEREAALGREEAARVAAEMGIVDDPALTAYVQAVGQRVARSSPRQDIPYRFQIVDMPEPNAFALPGGYVYVSRGLLVISNSEDELGNVIGHEIAHVAARHAAQREAAAVPVGILTALGTVAAGLIGGGQAAQAVGQLGQTAGAGIVASYGRDQEREADTLGQNYAAQAGVDPAAMSDFLATLERATALERGDGRQPSFFDTHPGTPERVASTASHAQSIAFAPQEGIAKSRAEFLRHLDGLVVGQNAEEGVVDGSRLLHPLLGFQVRYPEGWTIQNGRSAVLATSPSRDAAIVLEMEAPARSAREAAARFVQRNNLQVMEAGAVQLGSLDGYRALVAMASQRGPMAVDLTWIEHQGRIYRLTGLTPGPSYRAMQGAFASVARSFRDLTPQEIRGIRQQRLRIVTARAGETPGALAVRVRSSWNAEELAVANGVATTARFEAGQSVKAAFSEPWTAGTARAPERLGRPEPAPQAPLEPL